MASRQLFFIAVSLISLLSMSVTAAPGDPVYSEDFQSGSLNGWTRTGGNGVLAVGEYPPGSGERALTACCGDLVIVSPVINTAFAGAQLALRIQRGGAGIGSDEPENNEYLDLYFLDNTGSWQFMARYSGDGAAGEVINDSFTLTGELLHAGFRVRLEQRNGNPGEDYWHLHEVSIIEAGASGGIGSLCDDFSSGLARWTVNSFGGGAAITSQVSASPSRSLALFEGSARLHSLPLDLADATAATLNLWVRRGDDAFSENPDVGEDLVIGYLDGNGNHQELRVLAGDGVPGETFDLSFALPAGALHDAFQVRIERYGNGAGGYWHIDDVCVDIQRTLDHFSIRHDGSGVNCQAEPVQIVAHDSNHFIVENYTGGIGLATSTGNGDWSLLAGNGALANNGFGAGNYNFDPGDRGAVLVGLRYTFIETVNVDATDGARGEAASEDGNIVFEATGFNVLVNGNGGPVPAQIAGKPSNVAPNAAVLDLQAIRTNDLTGACEAAFTGNVNVELAFSCEEPASCSDANLRVNGSTVAANPPGTPAAFTTLALDFGDATDSAAPLVLQYDNAGSIRLHARHVLNPSGEIMSGKSNAFVVKPFGFDIAAAGNPGAAGAGGTVYRKAGEPFDVLVRAVAWQPEDDVNADGVPDGYANANPADNADLSDNPLLANFGRESPPDTVILGANLSLPATGTNPGLSGNTLLPAFFNDVADTTVNFSEAGIIELVAALNDSDYLGTGDVASRSGFVGRFVPDHFDVVIDSHGCNDAAGFSYSGQPLRSIRVTARNGTGGVARNFDGALGFARTVTLSEISGAAGVVVNGGISTLDFSNGSSVIGSAPAGVAFRFTDRQTAPATITLRAMDTDGISSQGHAEATTQVRSARFAVDDASVPVLAAAISGLRVETFDGAEWRYESQDACTVLEPASLSLGSYNGNLEDGETMIDTGNTYFANGIGEAVLAAPGAGNDGSLHLHYDADGWLEYDWQGTGAMDPFGTIRFFGIFSIESGFIQRYEVVP